MSMFLYYGGGIILLGFLFCVLLFFLISMSISVCYTNKKIESGFLWFWGLTIAFIMSYLNYGEINNILAFFIYFICSPLIIIIYGFYLLNKYGKK